MIMVRSEVHFLTGLEGPRKVESSLIVFRGEIPEKGTFWER